MSAPIGPEFMTSHLINAQSLAPILERHVEKRTVWASLEIDLATLGGRHQRSDELARTLVSSAAGYLAAAGGLPGVCVTCALEEIDDVGLGRVDMDLVRLAIECAAVLAVGVMRDSGRVAGVSGSAWLKAAYLAARISYTWLHADNDAHEAA